MTTAATRLVGLLGDPVRHSLSPRLHTAAYVAQDIDAAYLALPVAVADLSAAVAGLVATSALGANVTVPHKQAVLHLCDDVTDEAGLVGAVNTLVLRDGAVLGDNTDARGLGAALAADLGALAGQTAVVVGAGGAARAAVVALARHGTDVVVAARRLDAAREVAGLGSALGASVTGCALDDDALAERVAAARIVVNATPLGLHGEPLPATLPALGPGQAAYDLLYRSTPWQRVSRAGGAAAFDGTRMLVEQAARSHVAWFGGEPPVAAMLASVAG